MIFYLKNLVKYGKYNVQIFNRHLHSNYIYLVILLWFWKNWSWKWLFHAEKLASFHDLILWINVWINHKENNGIKYYDNEFFIKKK